MIRAFLISIAIIIIAGVFFYALLGGFKKPEFSIATTSDEVFYSMDFKGMIKQYKYQDTLKKAHDLLEDSILTGIFCIVHLQDPDKNEGRVHLKAGVIPAPDGQVIPRGYKKEVLPGRKVVRADITSLYSVVGSPEKVNSQLREFAVDNHLKLDTLVVEKYLNPKHLIVEIPILE
jgi:hypothetical protein